MAQNTVPTTSNNNNGYHLSRESSHDCITTDQSDISQELDKSCDQQSLSTAPKPPPRSTSIYHFQLFQNQQIHSLIPDHLETLMEHGTFISKEHTPSSSIASSLFKNVIMRDKKKKSKNFNHELRPKSDIYDLKSNNFYQPQQQSNKFTGENEKDISTISNMVNKDQPRPISMFFGGENTSRPIHKNSISRFSAYEISV